MDIVHGFTEECSDILKVYFSFLGRFSTNGNIFDFDDDNEKPNDSNTAPCDDDLIKESNED